MVLTNKSKAIKKELLSKKSIEKNSKFLHKSKVTDDTDSEDEELEMKKSKFKSSNRTMNKKNDDYDDALSSSTDSENANEFSDDSEESSDEKSPTVSVKSQKIDTMKEAIQQELNGMTFEEIIKLQNKLGLKKYKEVMSSSLQNDSSKAKVFSRLNKNRPQEISSKKPVTSLRNIFNVKKRETIDPRFNSAFGDYKPELFRKSYGFINDMRKNEKELLSQQLKEENDPIQKAKIKSALLRLKQQINTFEESEKKEALKQEFKKSALEDAKSGSRPHFVNKSEKKIIELAEKYKELKRSGKIENYLAKKRKKQLSKDNKHLNKNDHLRFV